MTNPPHRPSRQMPAKPADSGKTSPPVAPARPAAPENSSKKPSRPSRPVRLSGPMKEFGADEIEKQLAIKDVMDFAVRVTRAVQLAKQMESYKSRPFLLGLLAIPSLILFLYSYFARPDWVYGADPVRMSVPRRVAYTRLAMYLAAQRVESFRVTNGVLPGSLTELGEDWAGMSYQPLSATTFELSAPGQGGALVYRSDTPIGEFLGNSVPFLRSRGR